MSLYPLSEKVPERLRTPGGLGFAEITLDAVLEGRVRMDDLRITPEALELQAQIAEDAGRRQLAENLRRAAELASIPEEYILECYHSLRPGRADAERLAALATQLEQQYGARRCAALVREAAGLE
jgi:propanediol dehydratase small subunit